MCLAVLDLHCCVGSSLSVVSGGSSLLAVSEHLLAVAHCGAQALGHACVSEL